MKRLFSFLIVLSFPVVSLATGDHTGHHDKQDGHDAHMSHDHGSMSHGSHDGKSGRPGDAAHVSRTVEVIMDDNMRFTPSLIKVKAGETVRFFLRNEGQLQHEMVIGSMKELKEHAAMMRAQPNMHHADANAISLKPGQRGGIVWQFDQAGAVDFACLAPGHFETGMVGKVAVE